jgi:hypothetical protein
MQYVEATQSEDTIYGGYAVSRYCTVYIIEITQSEDTIYGDYSIRRYSTL